MMVKHKSSVAALRVFSGFSSLCFMLWLSACSSVGDQKISASGPALPMMEHIALMAKTCWFKSDNRKFRAYRLAPELKSFSDKPRILIVPYNNPNERPVLVIEATGNPARLNAYGPLMQTPLSHKINKNLQIWVRGGSKC